ncbi:MAG TPA: SPOR domain-containing protein [Rudaea sp.]|nr:SPOR domain-containing protein [Rudaea sp.]
MLARVSFLLLLALNIGGGLWLYFTPQQQHRPTFAASDPGITKLVLLSERERAGEANAAELAAAPESAADLRNDTCVSIGPFPTQADMRAALNALTPLVSRIQYREAHATETRGYWVYLPAQSSREQALAMARQLSSKGVRDYYVVTAGDQQNTISLGLFHDLANAEKRRNEIASLGFRPEMAARTEELPVYWVDFAQDSRNPVNWRSRIASQPDLRQQAVTCF